MQPSRQISVRAGFHFPFLAFREGMLGPNTPLPESAEKSELYRFYSNHVPHELQAVFVNPSYTLDDLLAAYRKYPGEATMEEERWLNDQMRKALYGQPDYVYPWVRLGQTSVAMLASAVNGNPSFVSDLATYSSMGSACGLTDKELSELRDLYVGLHHHHRTNPLASPLLSTGPVSALLSKLSARADLQSSQPIGGSVAMKLLTLVVLMLIGLSGFYLLDVQKAVMWLLFVMVAIPPLLAVMNRPGFPGGSLV